MQWRNPVILALLASTAWAVQAQSTPGKSLDLQLHKQPSSYPVSAATAAGVYYGDTSGNDGPAAAVRRHPLDDGKLHVHGTVSTSVGYAKGYGTGFSSAAEINLGKTFEHGGSFDLHLGVRKDDGFVPRGPYLHDARPPPR